MKGILGVKTIVHIDLLAMDGSLSGILLKFLINLSGESSSPDQGSSDLLAEPADRGYPSEEQVPGASLEALRFSI